MKHREETERGSVDSDVDEEDSVISISHKLNEIDWQEGDDDVREVVEKLMDMDFSNPYVRSYQENLRESYILYGRDGVFTQIMYMISNIEDDDLSDELLEMTKSLKR